MPPTTTETMLLPSVENNAPVSPDTSGTDDQIKHRKQTNTESKEVDENKNYSVPKYDKIDEWRGEIRWPDLIVQIFLHAGAVYGLYLCFYVKYVTILWGEFLDIFIFNIFWDKLLLGSGKCFLFYH